MRRRRHFCVALLVAGVVPADRIASFERVQTRHLNDDRLADAAVEIERLALPENCVHVDGGQF